MDEDSSGQLDFNEFRKFLSLLRSRPEVEQLFDALYEQFHEDDDEDAEESKEKFWSANEFLQFLREIQKVSDISYTPRCPKCLYRKRTLISKPLRKSSRQWNQEPRRRKIPNYVSLFEDCRRTCPLRPSMGCSNPNIRKYTKI